MKRTLLLFGLLAGLVASPAAAQDATEMAEGARLWAANCTRCHNARSPAERTDRQWVTITNHMRARANLTRAETQKIIVYLKMVNLPETVTSHEPVRSSRAEVNNRPGNETRSRAG